MKTKKQIDDARAIIRRRLTTEQLGDKQAALLMGILNGLIWAADGPDCSMTEGVLAGFPMRRGDDDDLVFGRLVQRAAALVTALKEISDSNYDFTWCLQRAREALKEVGEE